MMLGPMNHAQMAVQKQISDLRRKTGLTSPLAFAQAYLSAHLKLEPSRMHRELFAMLLDVSHQRGARLAIAAPRGHAKSTIVSLAYILWCICYRTERYIMLISNTLDQANDFLSQIKSELHPRRLESEVRWKNRSRVVYCMNRSLRLRRILLSKER